MVVVVLVGTSVEVGDKLHRNERIRDDTEGELAALDRTVVDPSVVIVPDSVDGPFVLHPRGALSNPPDLDAPRLYAADLLARNDDLFEHYPARQIYRLQEVDTASGTHADVQLLHRAIEPSVTIVVRQPSPAPGPATVAYVFIGSSSLWCPLAPSFEQLAITITTTTVTLLGCSDGTHTATTPSGPVTLITGIASSDAVGPPSTMSGPAAEARYWIDNQGTALEVIDPPDLWLRHSSQQPWRPTDPSLVPWIRSSDSRL